MRTTKKGEENHTCTYGMPVNIKYTKQDILYKSIMYNVQYSLYMVYKAYIQFKVYTVTYNV